MTIQHPYNISFQKYLGSAVPSDQAPKASGQYCWPSKDGDIDIMCEFSWFDDFRSAPSLQQCYDDTIEYLRDEAGVVITREVLEDVLEVLVERIEEAINEHDVPWYTPGIKRELKKLGVPVTKKDELDSYFSCSTEFLEAKRLVAEFGTKEAARKAADCEAFDSHYTGNLCGYRPHEIISSWQRLGIC